MTPEQLQIFWDHFRIIGPNPIKYDKPPTGWRPPAFRDMTEVEKEAYWAAFRTIMNIACEKLPDDSHNEAAGEPHEQERQVRRRIRGKQPDSSYPCPEMLADDALIPASAICKQTPDAELSSSFQASSALVSLKSVEASRAKNAKLTVKKQRSDEVPTKRRYVPKVKVDRPGKRPCVSIFKKVQLFKEPQ